MEVPRAGRPRLPRRIRPCLRVRDDAARQGDRPGVRAYRRHADRRIRPSRRRRLRHRLTWQQPSPAMRVHVAYVAAGSELVVALDVANGATVADALRLADIARRIGSVPDDAGLAIFGQRVDGSTPLRDG